MKKVKTEQKPEVVHTDIKKKKEIIKLIIFLVILTICIIITWNITKRKSPYQEMADFLNQEEDFDVLFFGSSHMYNAVSPMQLWNDYGIVSYNLANPTERIAISYYNMILALQEADKPDIIVIDAYMIEEDTKYNEESLEFLHNMLDAYPLTKLKYSVIKEIFSEGKENLHEREAEFLFNFSIYHARWSELTEEDFKNTNTYEKGAETLTGYAEQTIEIDFDFVDTYDGEENINVQYLRKMIEYCKDNDIEVIITYLPFKAWESNISYSKYVQAICDEYDVDYINFLNMDITNFSTDYANTSHVNQSGERKITNYLGNYIMENYDIQDQRENESYSFWYEDYDEYIDLKISNLNSNKSKLNNYLMLLYGEEDISYEIKVSSELEIEEESTLEQLLENLENNYEIDDDAFYEENEETGELEKSDKTIKITTWTTETGEEIDTVWF